MTRRVEHEAKSSGRAPQCGSEMIFKAYRRHDDRYIRPSALFGSGDRNPIPMTDLAGGLLSIEADDATLTHQRGNRVDTEFGSLLNGVVHAFAAGDTLR